MDNWFNKGEIKMKKLLSWLVIGMCPIITSVILMLILFWILNIDPMLWGFVFLSILLVISTVALVIVVKIYDRSYKKSTTDKK